MIKILMIVPFEEMTELVCQVWDEIEQQEQPAADQERYELTVTQASTTREVLSSNPDADVIIARGGTAYDLMHKHFHIPVIELMISANDILQTVFEVRERFGDIPAAVIGSPNMFEGVDRLLEFLGINCKIFYLRENTEEEIYRNVEQAVSSGRQIIIGGIRGCVYAENFGVHHTLLCSSRDSIWNALMSARQLGVTSRRNREFVLSNQAMLDNAFEGLISLDKEHRITALSTAAQKILGLAPGDWYIGMHIRDVLHAPRITALVCGSQPYVDEIVPYGNTHLSFKKVTLLLHGEEVGCVLAFLNATQLQETEIKLRGKIYERGHVAKYTFDSIIGVSPALTSAIEMARAYASTLSDIMIIGQSGTGKEMFAQSIHNASGRCGQPFVAINCAALPENLLESELFGYVAGAFTGANKSGKLGLFEQAHRGTIFLDEISEIPLALQGRLLRVLQEREVMRLGDDKVIRVDVRVICATNKDLYAQVKKGLFREDLLYRIDVLGLRLPALRERRGDVPLLAEHFIARFCRRAGRDDLPLEPEAAALLSAQPWPGNIRELQNFCERMVVLCREDSIRAPFVTQLLSHSLHTPAPASGGTRKAPCPVDADKLHKAIEDAGGNRRLAAERLGISRATLWRYLKRTEENEA